MQTSKKKFKYHILILCIFISNSLSAQVLYGRVLDDKNCALRQASIRLKNTEKGTLSDDDGNFAINVKGNSQEDTLLISYVGFQNREIPLKTLNEEPNITLQPSPVILQEISVSPSKFKKRIKGKKGKGGWMISYIDGETEGFSFGYEFHSKKNRQLILYKVGFYYCESDSQMSHMKFRINVYDASNVSGSITKDFVNILSEPIEFEYLLGDKKSSGRFEFTLQCPILLPKDAMVEIEMLENLGKEKFYFRSNMLGKKTWGRDTPDKIWVQSPFAPPFFVECLEIKE